MLVILGLIVSLLLVLVILFTCYRARKNLQRQQQVQQQQQHEGAATVNASSGHLTRSGKYPTPSVIIRNLPLIQYHPLGAGSTQLCAICFEDFYEDDKIKLLPCRHSYHGACIDAWLNRSHTCPMCNSDVIQAAGLPASITAEAASRTSAAPPTLPSASILPQLTFLTNTRGLAQAGAALACGSPAHHSQQQQVLEVVVVVVPNESGGHASQTAVSCPGQ